MALPAIFNTDIKFLSGVGEKRAELLKSELNIFTYQDLLWHLPFRHIDRTRFYKIKDIQAEMPYIQLRGKIVRFSYAGEGRRQRLVAVFSDGSGAMELVWFQGAKWVQSNYRINKEYIIFGKPTVFNNQISLVHPEIEDPETTPVNISPLQPVYNTTEKLKDGFVTSKTIQKLMMQH